MDSQFHPEQAVLERRRSQACDYQGRVVHPTTHVLTVERMRDDTLSSAIDLLPSVVFCDPCTFLARGLHSQKYERQKLLSGTPDNDRLLTWINSWCRCVFIFSSFQRKF